MHQILFACALLSLASQCIAAPVTHAPRSNGDSLVKYPIRKHGRDISRRQVSVDLQNIDVSYLIDLEIGTPGQAVTLSIDTGSSDIWVFGPGSCETCTGGVFDPSQSSTTEDRSDLGPLDATYFDGTTTSGYYIGDTVAVGDATATGVVLGVATSSSDSTKPSLRGIMGIGFQGLEGSEVQYPTFLDDLYNQGIISSHSYGIHLDDIESSSGTIVFGGYDSSAYTGDLVSLPIQPYTDNAPRLQVEWTSLSLTDSDGTTTQLTDSSLSYPVALDTGYTNSVLPDSLYDALASYFGAYSDGNNVLMPCDVGEGSFSFGFGSGPAVSIEVPFSEIPVPIGDGICLFGFETQGSNPVISFGDTFLRSAYAYYDFDDMTIGLAQAT